MSTSRDHCLYLTFQLFTRVKTWNCKTVEDGNAYRSLKQKEEEEEGGGGGGGGGEGEEEEEEEEEEENKIHIFRFPHRIAFQCSAKPIHAAAVFQRALLIPSNAIWASAADPASLTRSALGHWGAKIHT